MTKKINLWRPDTCKCEIEFEWDDAVPANERVHTFRRLTRACPEHDAGAHQEGEVLETVHACVKNRHKNTSINAVRGALGVLESTDKKDAIAWGYVDGKLNLTVPEHLKGNLAVAQDAVKDDESVTVT